MGQMGFFDIANRYAGLDAKNDPLMKIDEVVPWEDFRPRLEAAWATDPRTTISSLSPSHSSGEARRLANAAKRPSG